MPTYHPAAALRGGGGEVLAEMRADLVRAKQELGSRLTQLFTEHERVHGSLRMGFPMRRIATRTQGSRAA